MLFFKKRKIKRQNQQVKLKAYLFVDFRNEHLSEDTHSSETIALLSDYISKISSKVTIMTTLQSIEQGSRLTFEISEMCKNAKIALKHSEMYSRYLTNMSTWLSDYDTSVFNYNYQIYVC